MSKSWGGECIGVLSLEKVNLDDQIGIKGVLKLFLAREAEQGGQKSEYGRKTEAKRIPRKKTESILKIFNHPRKSDGWEDSSRSIQIVVLPGHQYNCFWNLFVFPGCGVNSIINNFTL